LTIIAIVGPSVIPLQKIGVKIDDAVWSIVADWSQEVKIISGGATGVDSLAKKHAVYLGHPFQEVPPDNNHKHWLCKDASPEKPCFGFKWRNIALAVSASKVYCVTFSDVEQPCYHCKRAGFNDEHRVSGGCWTMRYAESLNKEIELIVV
jgi:hypothetical protein